MREALNFLRNQPSSFESKECIISLVEKLIKGDDSEFCKKYLIEDSYSTNIVVTSCPHPKNKFKFLYHLLMYFGSFECEKLFEDNNMKKAFVAAGIVNEDNMRLSFNNLMRDIILDLFTWLPISTRKLSR